MTVTHVLSSLIASETEKAQTRMRACFILCEYLIPYILLFGCLTDHFMTGHLVTDDKQLCKLVYERGALTKLSALLKSITPSDPPPEWDADEPESLSALREVSNSSSFCTDLLT